MTERFDLIVRGGTVATPNGVAPGDVAIPVADHDRFGPFIGVSAK